MKILYSVQDGDAFTHYKGTNWNAATRTFRRIVRGRPPFAVVVKTNNVVAMRYEPKKGTP